MVKFLIGILIGILIFFFFVYFGGGKTLKKVGYGLIDTGKKMEVMEETIKKKKGQVEKVLEKEVKKRVFKDEKDASKKTGAPK
jgi:hypothetical protein